MVFGVVPLISGLFRLPTGQVVEVEPQVMV